MSDRAKIRARRVTGNDSQQQKEIARAIKNAREMALLPYANRVTTQRGGRPVTVAIAVIVATVAIAGPRRSRRPRAASPTDAGGDADELHAATDVADDRDRGDRGRRRASRSRR